MTGATTASVREALTAATDRLTAAGCDAPRLDAELLLAETLGTDRAGLVTADTRALTADQAARYEAFVARREGREPLAYVLGRKAFRHLELFVDARVLIPRPESELLVEAGLDLAPGARVHDVGTGSGAVALALKHERPDLAVTASDVSPGAVEVAQENARRLGLDVPVHCADLLDGVTGPLDAVLANLPYVEAADHEILAPEIAVHEPRLAVVGPDDGLGLLRRFVALLDDVPFVAMEVGLAQEDRVAELLGGVGFATETRRDLSGIERLVVGRR